MVLALSRISCEGRLTKSASVMCGAVFQVLRDLRRHLLPSESFDQPQAEVNPAGHAAGGDAVSVVDDALVNKSCAGSFEVTPRAVVRGRPAVGQRAGRSQDHRARADRGQDRASGFGLLDDGNPTTAVSFMPGTLRAARDPTSTREDEEVGVWTDDAIRDHHQAMRAPNAGFEAACHELDVEGSPTLGGTAQHPSGATASSSSMPSKTAMSIFTLLDAI